MEKVKVINEVIYPKDTKRYYECVKVKKSEIEEMKEIFSVQSPSKNENSMLNLIMDKLDIINNLSYTQDDLGNILVTKGVLEDNEYYPCLVAHTDTVHNLEVDYRVIQRTKDNVEVLQATCKDITINPKEPYARYYTGGCGDDGAGIWLVLNILKKVPKIKAVFTVEEEVGCVGALGLNMNFFNDCGYLIEGDRKGSSDIIFNCGTKDTVNANFKEILLDIGLDYKYSKGYGSFTDVIRLAEEGVGVSAVNLSVGYYEAHSSNEYTIINELVNARDYVLALLKRFKYNKYEHKFEKTVYKYTSHNNWDSYPERNYKDNQSFKRDTITKKLDSVSISIPKKEIEEDIDAPIVKVENCICSEAEKMQFLINLNCKHCNPILDKFSGLYCDCGQQYIERDLSYYCEVCGTHRVQAL